MTHIIIGGKKEIIKWIICQKRMTGKKIAYAGTKTDDGSYIFTIREGTKENRPQMRTVRSFDRSKKISE